MYHDQVRFPDGRQGSYVRISPQRKDPFVSVGVVQNHNEEIFSESVPTGLYFLSMQDIHPEK